MTTQTAGAHGVEVRWTQVYNHPAEPETCDCSTGKSDGRGKLWGATPYSEAPNGLASAGASNPLLDTGPRGADDHHGLT